MKQGSLIVTEAMVQSELFRSHWMHGPSREVPCYEYS